MTETFDRASQIELWRQELGDSAILWARGGRHLVEADRWLAFSRARSVDYNVAVCHGRETTTVAATLAEVQREGVPAVIMLSGSALGSAQPLVDAGWVCIGAQPLMALKSLSSGRPDPAVRRVTTGGLAEVRSVVATTFGLSPEMAAIAIPDDIGIRPELSAWVLREDAQVRAATAAVQTDTGVVIWSMATVPFMRRRGYGRRLLATVLHAAAEAGMDHSLLYASPAGEPLYRSVGYEVVEHWQLWSRPRWVLGRT